MTTQLRSHTRATGLHGVAFGMGFMLYVIAQDLVGTQGTADLVDRVALVFLGIAVPVAWLERRRGLTAFYAAISLLRALMGPPTVGPRSALHVTMTWCFIALVSIGIAFTFVNRWRASRPAADPRSTA